MAQRVEVKMIDDVDGSEATETVTFGLDGVTYEIDLNEKNTEKLRKALSTWTEHARRVSAPRGRKARGTAPAATSNDNAQIREWAQSAGVEVPARGRIPQAVRDQYEAAQAAQAAQGAA